MDYLMLLTAPNLKNLNDQLDSEEATRVIEKFLRYTCC